MRVSAELTKCLLLSEESVANSIREHNFFYSNIIVCIRAKAELLNHFPHPFICQSILSTKELRIEETS